MLTASLTKVRRCEGIDETGLWCFRCSWEAAVKPSGRSEDDVVESPCRASDELMLMPKLPEAIRPPKAAMVM